MNWIPIFDLPPLYGTWGTPPVQYLIQLQHPIDYEKRRLCGRDEERSQRCWNPSFTPLVSAADPQCEELVKRKVMVKDKPEEREVPCGEKKDLFKLRYNNGQAERTLCPEHFKKRWIEPGADEGMKI